MASDPERNPNPTNSGNRHHQSSPTDLFSSASLLAGAARSTFTHDGAALDKAKLAEASENLIDAASEYGKLQEKGYGSYVEKAETYLHQLHSSPEKKTGSEHSTDTEKKDTGDEEDSEGKKKEEKAPEEHQSGGGFGGFGGGGFGDYLKTAEGFLKK